MLKLSKKAFSFVELLVVVTILIIIGAIGISINDGYKEKTYNTKVVTDLTTLENALVRYKQENSFIPSPEGNIKYFTSNGSYAHDESEAFGFHGFITEKTIPKKYINVFPRDPRSKHYYTYGKTLNSGFFEVSGVISYDDKFESSVKGNYEGKDTLYNLIREYNGPDFVYDKSKKNFPYNPEEMIITARITAFTGDLLINNKIYSKEDVYKKDLLPGDNIKLSTGSTAILYYSDGTISYLGDESIPLELTLSVMKYKKEDNLFSRIRLALNFGNILTKAPKMASESNFNLYTTDTEASIRGTVFEVKRIPGEYKTTITVIKGSIFLNQINISSYLELLELLRKDAEISPKYPIVSLLTEQVIYNGNQESIMKEGGPITIIGGAVLPDTNTTCDPLNEHMESTGCKPNIENCDILDLSGSKIGVGSRLWNITRGNCEANICINGFHIDGNKCIEDENKCDNQNEVLNGDTCIPKIIDNVSCVGLPLKNALWNTVNFIKQEWNGNNYFPTNIGIYNEASSSTECRFKCKNTFIWNLNSCVCENGKHEEAGVCKSNTESCGNITNGTYTKTWNSSANNRGVCIVNCSPSYTNIGGTCKLSCPTGKHEEAGVCKSNTESCGNISNGTKKRTWNQVSSSRGNCIITCNSNSNWNGSSCVTCTGGYTWDSTVKKCKKTISGNGCSTCPYGSTNGDRYGNCSVFGGNRRYKKCNILNVNCGLEKAWSLSNTNCNKIENYNWSATDYK